MRNAWEVFDCRTGTPWARVPFRWLARVLSRRDPFSDFARRGEGW